MLTLQNIRLAAENSANAKHSAIYLRKLNKLATAFIAENPRDPIVTSMVRFAILEGFYKVLCDSSSNDQSICNILNYKYGISDVRNYEAHTSKTRALIDLLIEDLILSNQRFDSLESELRKIEPKLKPR